MTEQQVHTHNAHVSVELVRKSVLQLERSLPSGSQAHGVCSYLLETCADQGQALEHLMNLLAPEVTADG